jgi:hypothetical protein
MVQWLGGSFGVAIVGTIATTHYRSRVHSAYDGPLSNLPKSARAAVGDQIGTAAESARHLPVGLAAKVTSVSNHAFVGGLRIAIFLGLALVIVSTAAVARYLPRDIGVDDQDAKLAAAGG